MSKIASTDTASRAQEEMPTMASPDQDRDRERLISVLERELDAARTREQAALEREMLQLRVFEQAQQQLEVARERLEQAQRQFEAARERLESIELQRQLETAPSPAARPPGWQHLMRKRILGLLEERPEGLTRREIESLIGTNRHLGDTLIGMARPEGLLIRTGKGRYALARRTDTTPS
jgi:hypothetical protein